MDRDFVFQFVKRDGVGDWGIFLDTKLVAVTEMAVLHSVSVSDKVITGNLRFIHGFRILDELVVRWPELRQSLFKPGFIDPMKGVKCRELDDGWFYPPTGKQLKTCQYLFLGPNEVRI
jgi:hypothetical protein